MNRLPGLTLTFALAFAVLIIGPALLGAPFGPMPLMKAGDVLDVLTPLVLLPLYWRLWAMAGDERPAPGGTLVFMLLAAFWVEGQGMHLAANSIGHLLKDDPQGQAYALTFFYDEHLSHYLWHFGVVGLAALLLYQAWGRPATGERAGLALPVAAGALHGLTFFIIVVEAGTAPLGVPFAVLVALFGLWRGRGRLREHPLLAFLFVTYLVATLFFAGWAVYWGGLPQFSQVGIID